MGRPLLRYPGAKWRLAPWIISHLPKTHDSYAEPFAGSLGVLLRKNRSKMETVNDINGELIHLLQTLRAEPVMLVEAIRNTYWARREWDLANEPVVSSPVSKKDTVERARRFYVMMWQSIRPFHDSRSWRRQKVLSRGKDGTKSPMNSAARTFMQTDHLFEIADRLRGVQIEEIDAIDFIQDYDYSAALFYVDPPYLAEMRKSAVHYATEFNDEIKHRGLAAVLKKCQGMVVLSHYACELYRQEYEEEGWRRVDKESRIDGGGSRIESLYMNKAAQNALELETGMMRSLFD